MDENTEDYRIYILPHVYCNIKDGSALIYNTLTGEYIETGDNNVISFLAELHGEKNLGTVRISKELLQSCSYKDFLTDFISKGFGRVMPVKEQKESPIQMMPILSLQHEIDRIKANGNFSISDYLYRYLWEIDIYLNGKCNQNCLHCSSYSQQIQCCRKGDECDMPVDLLLSIAEQIKHTSLMKINFYGGNITEYSFIQDIDNIFRDFKGEIRMFNHIKNWTDMKLPQRFYNDIIITFPIDDNSIKNIQDYNSEKNSQLIFHFIVSSETEYAEAENIIETFNIKKYGIMPFYTGNNKEFFKKFIIQSKDEILSEEIVTMRDIFCHQKMNKNFFGKLTVLPDGTVYAVLGEKCIGNLYNDTLLKVIYNELLENTAWRCIRDKKPCSDCLFQYLCPSPSVYEKAMGINNLCLVK